MVYGVAADGGDDGLADPGDVLPVREELVGIHFGDYRPPSTPWLHPKKNCLRTGLVLHLLNIGARCVVCRRFKTTTPMPRESRTSKGLLGASEDDGTDLLVSVDETEGLVELSDQRAVNCVQRLGAMERHERDARIGARREDVLVLLAEDRHEAESV